MEPVVVNPNGGPAEYQNYSAGPHCLQHDLTLALGHSLVIEESADTLN